MVATLLVVIAVGSLFAASHFRQMERAATLTAQEKAVLADEMVNYEWLSSDAGKAFEFKNEAVFEGDLIAIAVRKGQADLVAKLNAAIKAIRANGTYQKINAKPTPLALYREQLVEADVITEAEVDTYATEFKELLQRLTEYQNAVKGVDRLFDFNSEHAETHAKTLQDKAKLLAGKLCSESVLLADLPKEVEQLKGIIDYVDSLPKLAEQTRFVFPLIASEKSF